MALVVRINTVAFHGIDVQNVDVQARISNGMPAFTIVGPIKPIIVFILLFVFIGLFSASAIAEEKKCALYGAEYVPQNLKLADSYDKKVNVVNRTLSFVLRIEKGDMDGPDRSTFLNFDAYNKAGEKVSTMRLSDTQSNGISRQSFSTQRGMYCTFGKDSESDCREMKNAATFFPIGVNQDMSQASISSAPLLLIFPGTYWELTSHSFNVPGDWDKYIHFYTPDRIYPDFRFIDFWIRRKCGEDTGRNSE